MVRSKNCQCCENRELKDLGDDLVAAIENACWLDFDGHKNLHGPTLHMQTAVNSWKHLTRSKINEKA